MNKILYMLETEITIFLITKFFRRVLLLSDSNENIFQRFYLLQDCFFRYSYFFSRILVYIAQRVHLFPFRTQKLSSVASMVLRDYTWESRYMPRFWKKDRLLLDFYRVFITY